MSVNNPVELLQAHRDLEESIIREIVQRLLKIDFQITETAGYQIKKAQESGVLYETIVKEASKSSKKTVEEIKEVFGAAGLSEVGFSYEGELSKRADAEKVKEYSPVMRQLYAAALNKACTSAVNFTKTTASTTQTTFIKACDLAHNQIVSGVYSYEAALANAIKSAADTGATTIHYESGVSRQLDSALRSAVMTGINQTVGEKALMDADILGTDIMETTITAAARPEHARWQGRLVSLSGRRGYLSLSDVGYGSVTLVQTVGTIGILMLKVYQKEYILMRSLKGFQMKLLHITVSLYQSGKRLTSKEVPNELLKSKSVSLWLMMRL